MFLKILGSVLFSNTFFETRAYCTAVHGHRAPLDRDIFLFLCELDFHQITSATCHHMKIKKNLKETM